MASARDITTALYLLASQAIPKLSPKYGIPCDFPSEITVPSSSREEGKALEARRVMALAKLFMNGAGGWDVFKAADIGAERETIATKFVVPGSSVLDLGCGRGFFSFACARRADLTVALDIMDGEPRKDWWKEFLQTSSCLGTERRVACARGSAVSLPF